MASPEFPELYSDFNLDDEVEASKVAVVAGSEGKYTNVANADPLIAAIRVVLGRIQFHLYSRSIRLFGESLILLLGKLIGQETTPPQKSRGMVGVSVDAGTVIPQGHQVADEVNGIVFKARNTVTFATAGVHPIEYEAEFAGTGSNTETIGSVRGVRNTVPVTTGNVYAAYNITPMTGGTDGETLEQWRDRVPSSLYNESLHTPQQYISEAEAYPSIAKVVLYGGVKPTTGGFKRKAGCMTLVCMTEAGLAPSQSVLDALAVQLYLKSYFHLKGSSPTDAGLFVIGVRPRAVNVSGVIIATSNAVNATVKTSAESNTTLFFDAFTGGRFFKPNPDSSKTVLGKGYTIGVRLEEEYLIGFLGSLYEFDVDRVIRESLTITPTDDLEIDEIVRAGTISFTVEAYRVGN
jgi:hypothetical protein